MSAPLQHQFASKQTIKCVISGNIIKAAICILVFTIPLDSSSFLSLINQTVLALKINILSILCLEIFSGYINPEKIKLKLRDWIKCMLIMMVSCVIYFTIAILFGAPLLEKTSETLHLAMLLTVTTILPCCLMLGPDISEWVNTFVLNSTELGAPIICHITSIMSVLGAWFGAFPIPLDWDRPWQVWPISCAIGNLIGYSSGLLISSIYLLYQYRLLNRSKLL